jgi:hypothetical protein
MKSFVAVAALALALPCPSQQKPGWKLTFDDEFSGATLDLSKWNPQDP